jgi:hypothetical protein
MANIITAGNSTNGGTAISTDTSGTLNIVTGSGSGANAITIDASQAVTMPGNLTVIGTLNAGALTNTTGSFSGNLSFNSGYGSAAVAYGCRAWVNFNGTGTVSIRASGNVTSITDNSTGDYTVNFTNAMPDANYGVSGIGCTSSGNSFGFMSLATAVQTGTDPTTALFRIRTSNSNGSALADVPFVNVSVFR